MFVSPPYEWHSDPWGIITRPQFSIKPSSEHYNLLIIFMERKKMIIITSLLDHMWSLNKRGSIVLLQLNATWKNMESPWTRQLKSFRKHVQMHGRTLTKTAWSPLPSPWISLTCVSTMHVQQTSFMRATMPTQMHHAWKVASVCCSWRKYPFKAKMLSSHMSCQINHRCECCKMFPVIYWEIVRTIN